MQKFYYNEKTKINALISKLNIVIEKFNNKDFDAEVHLNEFLSLTIQTYHQLGINERESEVQVLRAELMTAKRGVNPLTYEKQQLRKHEMMNTICFKIMQSLEVLLRNDLASREAKLNEAEQLVGQIIIAAIQSGILTNEMISGIDGQQMLEEAWAMIGEDPNINMGQKRVLMLVNRYDALILFDELLSGLK